ncbi:MAG: twin-arginine translocase TatA/TatE family subunit [Sphingomonadaceae bacterium]|nr:twin-arginine translocase TatA/TatE family subunit [Sphingomonadaceae bacterium]
MGGLSIWHWVIVGVVVLLLFGKGRISDVMGDLAKGITSFRKGLKEDENDPATRPAEPPRITSAPTTSADPVAEPIREDRPAG